MNQFVFGQLQHKLMCLHYIQFSSLGFALPLLRYRRWEQGAAPLSKEPRFLVFASAGQTMMSAEAIKSTGIFFTILPSDLDIVLCALHQAYCSGRNWPSKVSLYPHIPTDASDVYNPAIFLHRLFNFYENLVELILINYIGYFLLRINQKLEGYVVVFS